MPFDGWVFDIHYNLYIKHVSFFFLSMYYTVKQPGPKILSHSKFHISTVFGVNREKTGLQYVRMIDTLNRQHTAELPTEAPTSSTQSRCRQKSVLSTTSELQIHSNR